MFSTRLLSLIVILLLANACSTATRQPDGSEEAITVTNELNVTPEEKHLYRQAITALSAGDLNKAENLLKVFHQKKPEFAGPLANLALVYYRQGNKALAIEASNQALEKNSQQAQALNLLGQIAYEDGDAAKAEDYYKQALAIREDYANAHYNLALVYDIYFQDIARAVVHYQRYMELTNFGDKDTANWLEQLQNSLKSG